MTPFLRRFFLSLFMLSSVSFVGGALGAKPAKLADLREIDEARFNHDGSRVVVSLHNGQIGLWDVSSGKPVAGDLASAPAGSFVLSSDGKRMAVGLREGQARIFDASTAKALSPVMDVPVPGSEKRVLFSPDGGTILVFREREAVVFRVSDGKRIATIPFPAGPNEETPGSAAFAENGAKCFIMDGAGQVTIYDTKDWKPMDKTMLHPGGDSAYDFEFAVSEDGKWLATFDTPGENGFKGQLQVWDAVARKPLGEPLIAMNGHAAHFVGANHIAIIPCRGADANLRELPSMNVVSSFDSHEDLDGMSLDVSPDRKWILTWGEDGRLDLYDAASGKIESRCSPRSVAIKKVMTAPDSSGCIVFFDNSAFPDQQHHDDYIVRVSLPGLKITESLRSLEGISSVSLSPDGKRLLVHQGSADKERLLFFDAVTLKPLK
jgi:WD40 repeat protein